MSSVLLVAHHERPEAATIAQSAAGWLRRHGHTVWASHDDATALGVADLGSDRAPGDADLVLSIGGDGTMLRAVQSLHGALVPIVGINVGTLGYLTEVEPESLDHSLERWFAGPTAGEWQIDERMLLELQVHRADGALAGTWTAVNEGVVEKQEAGHTVRLQVRIDGAPFTTYAADGIIVATPTGSTAYSLSARGPVLSPRLKALLLTPVSPHQLFDRSLVLDPTESVEVELLGHRAAMLSVDGQPAVALAEGDRVTVVPSGRVARFVRFGERRFHQILKAKFGLTDR